MRVWLTIVSVLMIASLAVAGCAGKPVGNDVADDIKTYAYQNPAATVGVPYAGRRSLSHRP